MHPAKPASLLVLFVSCLFATPTFGDEPPRRETANASVVAAEAGPKEFHQWRDEQRMPLREMLGIPEERVPLNAERRGQVE